MHPVVEAPLGVVGVIQQLGKRGEELPGAGIQIHLDPITLADEGLAHPRSSVAHRP
jgi:hypothetical protein